MSYPETPCRLVRQVGRRPTAVVWWGSCTSGQHVARFQYEPTEPAPWSGVPAGWQEAEPPPGTTCEKGCGGAPWLPDAPGQHRAGSLLWVNDTDSGRPEPGCLYWAEHEPGDCFHWSNCDGRHLHVVLPNGQEWDVDSRASNCGLPDDREHRCWVRGGDPDADPPTVHVSKDGATCAAGAGSILSGDYHGFLRLADGRSVLTAG